MSITTNSGTVSFEYDGKKERVLQKIGSSSTLYLRGLSDYPLEEKNSNGTQRCYIYGPAGLIASVIESGSDTIEYYLYKDHVGSTRAVMNGSTGTGIEFYAYDSWGSVMASQVSPDIRYKFTGQEYDEQTGLHNFRARMYDSDIGRFYATDPAGEGFSPYGYVGNNPISNIDPTGRETRATWIRDMMEGDYLPPISAEILQEMLVSAHNQSSIFCGVETDQMAGFYPTIEEARTLQNYAAIYEYGENHRKYDPLWGTKGYPYGNPDEAARAGYYQIVTEHTNDQLLEREYGVNIYENKINGITVSYEVSPTIEGGEDEIQYEQFAARAKADHREIEMRPTKEGYWAPTDAAAVIHTHPTDKGFTLWRPQERVGRGSDTKFAYLYTRKQTIYVLLPRGDAYKWEYDYDLKKIYGWDEAEKKVITSLEFR